MSGLFFIPPIVFYLFILAFSYFFFYFTFWINLILFFLICYILFVFRRHKIFYAQNISVHPEVLLAPVHGKVESIRKNLTENDQSTFGIEIRMSLSLSDEKGLYMPLTGEVVNLKSNRGKKIDRKYPDHYFYGDLDDVSHTDLVFSSKKNYKYLLRFVDTPYCPRPVIWLKSGDKGRVSSCFGYYPLGGSVILFLPPESEMLTFEGEIIKPGQSVLAIIKEKN